MRVTGASRRLAIWGAMLIAAVLPATALAEGAGKGERESRHGRHGGRQAQAEGLSVVGQAVSRGDSGAYGLDIRGHRAAEGDESGGWVRFGQRTDDGGMALEGEITCLARDDSGIVQLTGTVRRGTGTKSGDKNGGGGRDGGDELVEVTRGGFRTTETEGQAKGGRRHHRRR